MFFSEFLRKPRPHLTPYPPAYPLILTPHLPPFPYLPILPFFWGSFPPCFFSLFSTHHFTLLPLPCAGVQVSYVHRSAPPVAFLCTSLSDKGQFRPFPKDLYIISPRQGRSIAQARLVHRGRPPETTPQTNTPADTPHQPINTNGVLTPETPENRRTRHRRICASPARRRRKRSLAMLFFSREDSW